MLLLCISAIIGLAEPHMSILVAFLLYSQIGIIFCELRALFSLTPTPIFDGAEEKW